MELTLHAGRFKKVFRKEIDDGPVFLAQMKCDEVALTVVIWATAHGNGRMCGFLGWVEVASVVPPSGCFPYTEDLV